MHVYAHNSQADFSLIIEQERLSSREKSASGKFVGKTALTETETYSTYTSTIYCLAANSVEKKFKASDIMEQAQVSI